MSSRYIFVQLPVLMQPINVYLFFRNLTRDKFLKGQKKMQVTQTFYIYGDLFITKQEKKYIFLIFSLFLLHFFHIISTTVLLSDFFRAQKNDRTEKDFCNLPWGRLLSCVSSIMEFILSLFFVGSNQVRFCALLYFVGIRHYLQNKA